MTKGKITISRISGTQHSDFVRIEIIYDNKRIGADLELEDYAKAITNIGRVPCSVTTWEKPLDNQKDS